MNTHGNQNPNTTGPGPEGQMGAEKQPGFTGAGADTGAGATAAGGGVGGKLKSAYHVIHGLGENVRGTALGAVDTVTNKGGSENDEIARRGRMEMEQGLAAFKQPKPGVGAPNAPAAGHAGGAMGGGGPGTGPTGAPGHTQTGAPGQDPGPQAAQTFPTPQHHSGVAGSNGYNAPPSYGDTRTHPGETGTTTGAYGGPGAPGGAGATSTMESRNGAYGQQHPATDSVGQHPPGSQRYNEEGRNREPASGYHDPRVDPQNGNQGRGGYGYGQTEKHTTEQFASRATSVPNRGASQANDNNMYPQGQRTVEGRNDENIGGPVHHHRDDAVTDLNARPGEKHGDGQLSTANGREIPDYDRNRAFDSQPGGRNGQGGGMGQQGFRQGQGGTRGEMPGSYGGNADEGYKDQYEQ